MIKRGEIVLVPFPFTNLATFKVRPALIVSSDSFNKTSGDAIFLFITSKKYNTAFDLRINKKHPDFKTTGLKTSSTFRASKLMCLEQGIAKRRLGHAGKRVLKQIDTRLKRLLLPGNS